MSIWPRVGLKFVYMLMSLEPVDGLKCLPACIVPSIAVHGKKHMVCILESLANQDISDTRLILVVLDHVVAGVKQLHVLKTPQR